MEELAYVGKIIQMDPIEGADRIMLATAVCGPGGKWRGVVPKDIGQENVIVVLPDAILPRDEVKYDFMGQYRWRVRQRTFKGVPSECLILPFEGVAPCPIGTDLSDILRLVKYEKPSGVGPTHSEGDRPSFIPKTDEPLLQKVFWMLTALWGQPYQITKKMDGSSTTAYRYQGKFGVCSRNLELKPMDNVYWRAARKYDLENKVPEGMAIQFETCGPGVQGNKAGLSNTDGFVFQVYDIEKRIYIAHSTDLMQNVSLVEEGESFNHTLDTLQALAMKQVYGNGKPAEGIVVRSKSLEPVPMPGKEYIQVRLSFKVINLLYKD